MVATLYYLRNNVKTNPLCVQHRGNLIYLFLYSFDLWVVESMDVEPRAREGGHSQIEEAIKRMQ